MVKTKFLLSVVFLLSVFTLAFADYNTEQILLRQANNFTFRRQYERANSIYKQILDLNPNNKQALEKYFKNLLYLNDADDAKKLLQKYKNNIDPNFYEKLNINLLLSEGDFDKAEKRAVNLLKNNPDKNNYIIFANMFQAYKQFDIAKNIYLLGRKKLNDKFSFSYELAYIYSQMGEYKKAIEENIKLLTHQKNYFYLVKRNIGNILKSDKSAVKYLENPKSEKIRELYIWALLQTGQSDKALQNITGLSPKSIKEIADDQEVAHNFDYAVKLFQIYAANVHDAVKIANTKVEIAKIYLTQGKPEDAKEILMQIYRDEKIQSKRYNRQTKANVECRKLLSQITLMEKGDENKAIRYLKEAKKLSYDFNEKRDIDLQLVFLSIMKSRFKNAEEALNYAYKNEKNNPKRYYYDYLINALQINNKADSLLTDLIINLPESNYTNDALLLSYYLSLLDKDSKKYFVKAYQYKKLFRYNKAHQALDKCFQITQKEQFLLLSMKWYIDENNISALQTMLQRKYKNKFIENFAQYVKLTENNTDFKEKAVEFLKKNPDSIFSPQIRSSINVNEQAN